MSSRQEAGITMLNADSVDAVNSAKFSKDFMEHEDCYIPVSRACSR